MSIVNEWSLTHGYQQAQTDDFQLHTRLVVRHQERIWVVNCSAKTDTACLSLPEKQQSVRPLELIYLGFFLLWRNVLGKLQRATNCFYAKWCRLNTDDLHHNR